MENKSNRNLNIVIIGLPGCGKGTQSEILASKYSLAHISSGDLLRDEQEKNTPLGRKIAKLMEEGVLFPDNIVNSVVLENVPPSNYILDGYPRKLSQVEVIKSVNAVIYLTLPEKVAIKRILDRHQGRVDDNEEAIKIRLEAFREETKPVIKYYSDKGLLVEIDASGTPEEVFERIETALKKLIKNF